MNVNIKQLPICRLIVAIVKLVFKLIRQELIDLLNQFSIFSTDQDRVFHLLINFIDTFSFFSINN